jgi:hypothetical protein
LQAAVMGCLHFDEDMVELHAVVDCLLYEGREELRAVVDCLIFMKKNKLQAVVMNCLHFDKDRKELQAVFIDCLLLD